MVYEIYDVKEFCKLIQHLDINRNPFQTVGFYKNYFLKYPSKNYVFFIVKREDIVVGIAPFEIVCNNVFLCEYSFIATRKINYQEYLCKNEDMEYVHEELVAYFNSRRKSTKINYYDINNKSKIYEILYENQKIAGTELYRCPVVVLEDDFEKFFKTQIKDAKKRTEIRKFYNKLSWIGDVKMLTVDSFDAFKMYEKYINEIFFVHKERFDKVYTPSHFSDIKFREYYLNIIKDMVSTANCYLSILVVNETVISFVLCLANENSLIDWIPAFDPAFEKYNLGTVHYYLLFQKLCEEGKYKYFDYSKGDSVYKRRWANAEMINYSFDLLLNGNIVSKLIVLLGRIKAKIKVCLRKRGVLKKIKKVLGKYIKEDVGEVFSPVPIKIINVDTCENNFDYALIRKTTIENRLALLNSIYAGKSVNLQNIDGRIIAEVSK